MWRSIKAAVHKRSASKRRKAGADEAAEPKASERPGLFVLSNGELNEDENNRESFKVDVVAIHGLNGDAYNTWTHQKTQSLWLKDRLPQDLPGARIYTYGYPSHLLFSRSKAEIRDYAMKLLVCLNSARGGQEKRPIIFIAHSLGGIVCKQALILAYRNAIYSKILESTIGIFFFGTPHRGARGTPDMGIFLGNMVDLCLKGSGSRPFVGGTRSDLLAALNANSPTLRDVAQDFSHLLGGLQIVTLYELEEKVPLGRLIVDQDSAIMAIKGERTIPMHADHTEMCRFAPSDPNYNEVVGVIREVYSEATSSPSLAESEKACVRIFNDVDIRDYRSSLPARVAGTCQWILKHPQYDAWATENQVTMLWITGHPGCGKTILSSYLTEQLGSQGLSASRDPLVCFFFCNDTIENQRDAKAVLRSLIFQILMERRDLIGHVKPLLDYDRNGEHLLKSYDRLWSIFCAIASDVHLGPANIIIDALDECEKTSRNRLVQSIANLIDHLRSTTSRCIRFLITSRPYLMITDCFTNYEPHLLNLEERQEIDADVRLVISQRVKKIAKKTKAKQETIFLLERSLSKNADRTFLWAKFALDILDEELTTAPEDFHRILEEMPRDLEATYERFLNKVQAGQQEFVTNLLRLMIATFRPLTLDEVSIIDAASRTAETGRRTLADMERHHLRTNIRADIHNILGPLVRISDSKVYLVHISLKEFLCTSIRNIPDQRLSTQYHMNMPQANLFLASAGMTYLSLDDFSEDLYAKNRSSSSEGSSQPTIDDHEGTEDLDDSMNIFGTLLQDNEELDAGACTTIAQRFSLFEYSATSWARHFAESQDIAPQSVRELALHLSEKHTAAFSNWFRFLWTTKGINMSFPSDFDALVVAGFFNHYVSLETILNKTPSMNDNSLASALYWASRNGNFHSVLRLLQTAVEPDSKTVDRQSSLCTAAQFGHFDVVKALAADDRVDINFEGKDCRTPLSMAAGNGHTELVRLLLSDERTKADVEDSRGRTPLFWAVDGHHPIVTRLLASDHRVDVNHVDNRGRTPFSWAAEEGKEDVVATLLKIPGTDVDRADDLGRTPLSWAAGRGHTPVIKQLKRSKRLDTSHSHKDHTGRNAIGWAAWTGQNEAIKQLIKYKVPGVDEEDESKWTPLFWALEAPNSTSVATLLDTGLVNVNHKDHNGRTALFWAAGYGNRETLQTLLATEGIDPWATDNEGRTPLGWALKLGKQGTAALLENSSQ